MTEHDKIGHDHKVGSVLAAALAILLLCVAIANAQSRGAVATTSAAEVCATDGRSGSAYSRSHRLVHRRGRPGYELDHVVPICLGGADTEANLQWQPIEEARVKDRLEAYACREVCVGRVGLATAQGWFLMGWGSTR